MSNDISAYNDIFIQYFFSKPSNENALVDIINSVESPNDKSKEIKRAKVKNPFNPKDFDVDKHSYLDIVVTDEEEKSHNIEFQVSYQKFFSARMLYYWSKIFTNQIEDGEHYYVLKPVTSMAFIGFNMFDDINNEKMIHHLGKIEFDSVSKGKTKLKNNDTEFLKIHIIEINKINKDKPIEEFSKLELWVYFFLYEGTGDQKLNEIIERYPLIKKAHMEFLKFTNNEEYRKMIDRALESRRIRKSEIYYAREEGIEQAREEARKEKIKIARGMREKGIELEIIEELTGIAKEDIEVS